MSNFISRRIATLLTSEEIPHEENIPAAPRGHGRDNALPALVQEVYEKLGGLLPRQLGKLPVPDYELIVGKKMLACDDELCFNRYAAQCYRSPFYHELAAFNSESYLRYCRQFEAACKKGGLQGGVWTNRLAEEHFGPAADPGDFFGAGSPGWKMIAFRNFLRDLSATAEGYTIIHFSVYDQLMVDGKLLPLGDLLKSPAGAHLKATVKHLRRRLGLPVVAAE